MATLISELPQEFTAASLERTAADDRMDCLAAAPLFDCISLAESQQLALAAHEQIYSPGQTIFLEEDPVRHVFVVAAGMVKVSQVSETGKEILLRIERRGGLIDDLTAAALVHSVTARAMDSCSLLLWEASVFERFSRRVPALERNAVAIMRARLTDLQERFCDVATCRVPQRLARLVVRLAADEPSGSLSPIGLSREELAQMTGTSLFTVSRLLSEWAGSDVLTVDRRTVVVEDLDRLRRIAEAA